MPALSLPPAESHSSCRYVGGGGGGGLSKTPQRVQWNEWVVSRFLWVESVTEKHIMDQLPLQCLTVILIEKCGSENLFDPIDFLYTLLCVYVE